MRPARRLDASARRICTWLVGVLILGVLYGCSSSSPTEPAASRPAWLQTLIAKIESEPVTNPPSSILQYRYRGAAVYFRPSRCCDMYSDLYDETGALLCHPDGGLTGAGDGACTDFFSSRQDEQLVWQDPRR